jgi:predicted  nucleic acid-binding Zn-ribbon protein
VDGVAKDLQAFRMEERERLLSTMEEVKTLKEEVAELRSKINEMNLLIYSIEMKMRELEEKLFNELTEIKLLMISKERESRAQ